MKLEQANKILKDRSFNGNNQYANKVAGYGYSVWAIKVSGSKFVLTANGNPRFYGSLTACLRKALGQIESAQYYLELQAIQQGHIFCYLPNLKTDFKAANAYPAYEESTLKFVKV